MFLAAPPPAGVLAGIPRFRLVGLVLHRVHLRSCPTPWWFASAPDDPREGGRFDLPSPRGTCYFGTSTAAAVLEALEDFGTGLLPEAELRRRTCSTVVVPPGAPAAAHSTAKLARGHGVAAGLWADGDRALTQQWAAALDRAGWQAVRGGTQHDPSGRSRAVALFDVAGQHPPYADASWTHEPQPLDDAATRSALAAYGIRVTPDPELPVVRLEDSGLLED